MRRLMAVGMCLLALSASAASAGAAGAAGVHPARVPAPALSSTKQTTRHLLIKLRVLRIEFYLLTHYLFGFTIYISQRLEALEREMRAPNANIPKLLEIEEKARARLAAKSEEITARQDALAALAEPIEAELRALGGTPPPWP
jgi:dienelactone hydrolase